MQYDLENRDKEYEQAVGLLVLSQRASTSFLQRQLGIQYNAAARLMERAEDEGVVSRPDRFGRRDVIAAPKQTYPNHGDQHV